MQTLQEKQAQNPDAFDFEKVVAKGKKTPAKPKPANRFAESFSSLAAMCGVEIDLKRGNLYCKPPKLKQERAMLTAQRKFGEGEAETALDIAVEAVLTMLYVREGETLRPAEESDIEDVLESADLLAILSGAMGVSLTETDAGNA